MISPGFFSFFNSQRALFTAQTAMNTVSHNISNANTPGYSKQRVEMEAHFAYSAPLLNARQESGQIGQGVTITEINRSRDVFLDASIRQENSILGTNVNLRNVLQQLEGILNEPSTGGINGTIQNLFEAAQELSLNPESTAVRTEFLQQGIDLITVFQQQGQQLQDLRRNLVGEPGIAGSFGVSQLAINVQDINDKLETIAQLNREILAITTTGATPNDLFDQRDLMLDELSQLVDIDVTATASNQINVEVAGQLMVRGVTQLDSLEVVENTGVIDVAFPVPDNDPSLVRTVTGGVTINNLIQDGAVRGILTAGGNGTTTTTVRGVLGDLDTLLTEIATQVNALQATGRDINGNLSPAPIFDLPVGAGLDLFRYQINPTVLADPNLVAAAINDPAATGPPAGFAGPGDGRNALLMGQLRDGAFAGLGNTGFVEYFNGVVANLGIDTRSFENRSDAQESLTTSLDLRRQSISGVNVEEELIDMIRFQRAFEAASKVVQVFDEIVQNIINIQ
ncbi:MAG: flagellar hook-associated protein FlgK [Vampirovibrio sp.]|nr:flagellar hook-associated protein FlgK [Vampirovibrio sp.]